MISVTDFLTPADQVLYASGTLFDATYAFDAAQAADLEVAVPAGLFGLVGFQPRNGLHLRGASPEASILKQMDPERPALEIRSATAPDQLLNLHLSGFLVVGADEYASATTFAAFLSGGGSPIAAVYLHASGAGAITNGYFEYYTRNTYSALTMAGMTAGNIYDNRFVVTGAGHRGTAAKTGGPYNRYELFLTQCDSFCIDDASDDSEISIVGENVMRFGGQRNVIRPRMEGIVVAAAPANTGIIDANHKNTYINPLVNLFPFDLGKLAFAFRGFSGSVWINPQIVGLGAASPLYPFGDTSGPVTVVGGRGVAAPIEAYHSDPAGIAERRFDRFTLLGQNDGLSNRARPTAHKVFAPTANLVSDLDPTWVSIEVNSTLNPRPIFSSTWSHARRSRAGGFRW